MKSRNGLHFLSSNFWLRSICVVDWYITYGRPSWMFLIYETKATGLRLNGYWLDSALTLYIGHSSIQLEVWGYTALLISKEDFHDFDVASQKHDCCILSRVGTALFNNFTFANDRNGFHTFLHNIFSCQDSNVRIRLELTRHYNLNFTNFFLWNSFFNHYLLSASGQSVP